MARSRRPNSALLGTVLALLGAALAALLARRRRRAPAPLAVRPEWQAVAAEPIAPVSPERVRLSPRPPAGAPGELEDAAWRDPGDAAGTGPAEGPGEYRPIVRRGPPTDDSAPGAEPWSGSAG
jgi:hypothetical protein